MTQKRDILRDMGLHKRNERADIRGKAESEFMYSYQARIRYSELDESGHLKPEALLDYFQDCSTFQSEDLGVGIEYLREKNMVWVLSSWQIIVDRYPVLGEVVTVGTQPYEFKGFMGFRNFVMEDASGKRIACANALFSLINIETAGPMRPTEEMLEKYVLGEKIDMEYAPRKIRIPDGAVKGEEVLIRPHHLDTNHHVNNGQYVRIAIDSLQTDCHISQLRAEYKKQVRLHEVLTPYIVRTEKGGYVVDLRNQENETCCIVEIEENGENA